MSCPSCGTPYPDGARFCPSCGAALDRRTDERRLVTVLFADLVGYTTLAETRDPEAVKNLVDDCFERLVADVVAFGGVVDKIIGDAIVALFGAPVAHEDDAERAVRAALRMQETLAAQSPVLGVDLRMRIGVNSGEVLVGTLRSGGDYTAMGDVVNTASRLQSLAAPGQVLVGPGTHASAGGIRFEPLGLLRAKGRDEPVPAWAATEVLGPPGVRFRASKAPLVGRDAEVGMLGSLLRATAARRRAGSVLLVGEAGLGKTRLVDELTAQARSEGFWVLEGRCVPYGEVNVWAPLAEALRRASGVSVDDEPEAVKEKGRSAVAAILELPPEHPEVVRLVAALGPLMGHARPTGERVASRVGASRDSEAVAPAAEEALWAMQTCVERLTSRRPLLIAIGELHWADDVLLVFLDRLVQRVADLPVLLVATARPELLGRWQPGGERNNRTLLHVDPLDDDAAAELLAHLAGPGLAGTDRRTLVARSGGNPLWLEELAALSGDGDAPVRGEVHVPDGLAPLPPTLRGMVAARLDLLDPPARALLEDAAVCGRNGSVAALEAMAERAGRPLDGTALEDLCASGLLSMVHRRETWELRSELVREVAYGTLTKAERARRHARLASWLVERGGADPRDDTLDELAHHWAAAADLEAELGLIDGLPADTTAQALHWLDRAAARAAEQELWLPAATLLDAALRLDGAVAPTARAQLLLRRARARVGLHEVEGASADIDEVSAHARDAGDDELLLQALVVRGDVARTAGQFGESEHVLRQAVDLAREVGDEHTALAALRSMAQTLIFAGQLDRAEPVAAEARRGAAAAGDRRTEAWALQNLAWIAFYRNDLQLAESRLADSAAAFEEVDDPGGRGWALGLLAWVYYTRGELDRGEALARRVVEESHTGDHWAEGVLRTLIANTRLFSGSPGEAVEAAEAALRACRSLFDRWPSVQALSILGRARLATGDIEGGRRALEEAIQVGAAVEDVNSRVFPRMAYTTALTLQLGEGPAAAASLSAVRDAVLTNDASSSDMRAVLAAAALQDGSVDEAVALVEPLVERVPLRPSVAPWVALTLLAAGRRQAAAEVLAQGDDTPPTYLDTAWRAVAEAVLAPDDQRRLAHLEAAAGACAATGDVLTARIVDHAAACLVAERPPRMESPPGVEQWSRLWDAVRRGADVSNLPTGR